jgi:hypothetical protein
MKNRNAVPSDEQSYNTLDNNDTIVINKTIQASRWDT